MRYITFLLVCLLFSLFASGQEQTKEDSVKQPRVFAYVEQMPNPGYSISGYLNAKLHYPQEARKNKITGTVIVKFIVTETGAIDSVRVLKGIGGGCDEEAIRVMKGMPQWKPGKQNGKPVKVYFTQPITFNL